MSGLVRGACALILSLVVATGAEAVCGSAECSDTTQIETVRDQIAAACDCVGAKSHRKYTRCAKELVKVAIREGRLGASCRKTVTRCEAQSTCGVRNAGVCCLMKDGTPTARMTKKSAKCKGGTFCSGAFALGDACTAQGACTTPRSRGVRSFKSVQQVFTQSCALPSCHSTFARKGGLVLDSEDVSYISLVDRPAVHPDAPAGLLRVKSGDPANSYLIQKLHGEGPGDVMPQTGGKLADPIIKMIEDWIRRGAHSTAEECPARAGTTFTPLHGEAAHTICDDEVPPVGDYVWAPEPALEVPAPNQGIQLYTPPRPVDPGTEWETCYAFRPDWQKIRADVGLAPDEPLTFKQQTYRMHSGSHHLLMYAYLGNQPEGWKLNQYFPCFAGNPLNEEDGPPDAGNQLPFGGTQVAGTRYEVKYPQGVGIPILPDPINPTTTVIIANLHYTNPFQPAQPIYGEAWLNMYFHAPGEFKALLDGIFAINVPGLFVEPFTSHTTSRIWKPHGIISPETDAAVFQLFGHMHKRGVEFRIDKVSDGKCSVSQALCGRDDDCACQPYERNCTAGQTCVLGPAHEDSTIYYTTSWDHAPILDFPKPYFSVRKEEGLRWTCTHTNGVEGDPNRPPKRCRKGCRACGWDEATNRCVLDPRRQLGSSAPLRYYNDGDPMPLVFGELADDDMCNMFGYFITQENADRLP